ncbi:sensor histidine kinase [Paenibacillus sp. GD4]|uniref:cache domain-containing sensor histidine kinase n=1 Tax=Paenibacillus sp. GD4 TaxID=3068890 RepID=UPI0027963FC8|nr:sensor histidine kinase [Paenibacillus sp. GD4]MDQ1910277.1 sensor histidine kinase [Paenibacillus sp. GD4]
MRQRVAWVGARFGNLRIKYKLLLSYLLLMSVTISAVTWFSYDKSRDMMENQIAESTGRAFEQANQFISYKLNNVKDVSSMLVMNKELEQILRKRPSPYPLAEQIDDYNRLLDIIRSAQNSREIYSIRLFVNHTGIFSKEKSTIFSMGEFRDTDWFPRVLEQSGGLYCRPTYLHDYGDQREAQQVISCLRTLQTQGFFGDILGMLSMDILEDSIYRILEQTNITNGGQVYLVDRDGSVISGLDRKSIGSSLASAPFFKEIAGVQGSESFRHMTVDGKPSMVTYKQVEGTDWRLIAIIPHEEMFRSTKQIASYMLLLFAAATVGAAVMAFFLSGGITRRISTLIKQMKRIEEEKWDDKIPVDSTDEIGILQAHFNRMTDNIKRLILEKYEEEVRKKNAELKALQAQINPHFLYNTLDMVHWLALKHKAPDISYIAQGLARFFRLSLSNGRDVISIRDELAHVQIYLDIQNKRFSGGIETVIDVEEELLGLATVKTILQPIVENAVLHGIRERDDKRGLIRIAGVLKDGLVQMTVEDNGVGMSEEALQSLLAEGKSEGYGIKNVNDKIKLYFGGDYGLSYESVTGRGTKVTIRFPAAELGTIGES